MSLDAIHTRALALADHQIQEARRGGYARGVEVGYLIGDWLCSPANFWDIHRTPVC